MSNFEALSVENRFEQNFKVELISLNQVVDQNEKYGTLCNRDHFALKS